MPPHRVYIETHLGGAACLRNKRPATINIGIDRDRRVIDYWRTRIGIPCELLTSDAVQFLRRYQFVGDELVYADPPYLSSTRRRELVYRHDYNNEDHLELLQVLKSLPCAVVLSGYDNEIYSSELADWRHLTFSAMTHCGVREESVWMNFAAPGTLHDARYLGDTFHVRQAIRRRRERLVRKVEEMPTIERQHTLAVLWERFGVQADK